MNIIIDRKELEREIQKLETVLTSLTTELETLRHSTQFLASDRRMLQGAYADNVQAFFREVHGTALSALETLVLGYKTSAARLLEAGAVVDGSATAHIESSYIQDVLLNELNEYRKATEAYYHTVNSTADTVSDILSVELPRPNTTAADAYEDRLNALLQRMREFDALDVVEAIQTLRHELVSLFAYMDVCSQGGSIQYTTGALQTQSFYAGLRRAQEAVEDQMKRYKKIVEKHFGVKQTDAYSADPVNLSTGNFIYEKTDIAPHFFKLSFKRFYNSMKEHEGVFGQGFLHTYESFIEHNEMDQYILHHEDGRIEIFHKHDEVYVSEEHPHRHLEHQADDYYRIDLGNEVRSYTPRGYLAMIEYDTYYVTCVYNDHDELLRVRAMEEELVFTYTSKGKVQTVTSTDGRRSEYQYEGQRLTRVSCSDGTRYRYAYDAHNRIRAVYNTDDVCVVENVYDEYARVERQRFADGSSMTFRYDDFERKLELTERNGARTAYFMDANYNPVRIVSEDGTAYMEYNKNQQKTVHITKNKQAYVYTYDEKGQLIAVTNPLGHRRKFTYDTHGNLSCVVLENGATYTMTYTEDSKIAKLQTPNGSEGSFVYTDQKIAETQDLDGVVQYYTYDDYGNMTSIADDIGTLQTWMYNERNECIEMWHRDGRNEHYTYDEQGRRTSITFADGRCERYTYDVRGNVETAYDIYGMLRTYTYNEINKVQTIREGDDVTTYTYDRMWNIASITHPNGTSETYEYDRMNRLSKTTDVYGNCMMYTYDPEGNCICEEDMNGNKRTYVYDACSRCTEIHQNGKKIRTYRYDAVGNCIYEEDALHHVIRSTYDLEGNRIRIEDVDGGTTTFTYTPFGRVASETNAYGAVIRYEYRNDRQLSAIFVDDVCYEQYVYDATGRCVSKIDADGQTTTYSYNESNQVTSIFDTYGKMMSYVYDAYGRCVQTENSQGQQTMYTYTSQDMCATVTDANGVTMRYVYDTQQRLHEVYRVYEDQHSLQYRYFYDRYDQVVRTEFGDGTFEEFAYDTTGHMYLHTHEDATQTHYTYDYFGRVASCQLSDGTTITYAYDEMGRCASMTDALGTTSYHYTRRGLLERVDYPDHTYVSYTYGKMGERTGYTTSEGDAVTYVYNPFLQCTSMIQNGKETAYTYTKQGYIASKTFGDQMIQHQYDARHRKVQSTYARQGVVEQDLRYVYDTRDNIIETLYEANGQQQHKTLTYDRLNRLIGVQEDDRYARYTYDVFGNRTHVETERYEEQYTYQHDRLMERSTDDTTTQYTYDLRGRCIEKVEHKHHVPQEPVHHLRYTYNDHNLLTHATSRDMELTYRYRGNGTLYERHVTKGNTTQTQHFLMDETRSYDDILSIRDADAATHQTFLYDSEGLHLEHMKLRLNDICGTAIEATQGVFGETDRNDVHIGFTGYLYEPELDAYYAKARFYDALTGRFQSKDRLHQTRLAAEGSHRYVYAYNKPTRFVDYDGNIPVSAQPTLEFVTKGFASAKHTLRKASKKVFDNVGSSVTHTEERSFGGAYTGTTTKHVTNPDAPIKLNKSYNSARAEWKGGISIFNQDIGVHFGLKDASIGIDVPEHSYGVSLQTGEIRMSKTVGNVTTTQLATPEKYGFDTKVVKDVKVTDNVTVEAFAGVKKSTNWENMKPTKPQFALQRVSAVTEAFSLESMQDYGNHLGEWIEVGGGWIGGAGIQVLEGLGAGWEWTKENMPMLLFIGAVIAFIILAVAEGVTFGALTPVVGTAIVALAVYITTFFSAPKTVSAAECNTSK